MDRDSINDFSYWFERVKDCGMKIPKTIIIKTPPELHEHFYMDNYERDYTAIEDWVNKEVIPLIRKEHMQLLFIKNARFSNKFDATTCFVTRETLTYGVVNINYAGLCVGADGFSELVIRDRISYDRRATPCIYNGLPLRPEFRLFYNFDKHKVEYIVNYWDYDNCIRGMHTLTDRIIFEHMKDEIEAGYNENKDRVCEQAELALKNVTGLDGIWSVDILMQENGDLWLIDMGTAERSAYWNPELIKE